MKPAPSGLFNLLVRQPSLVRLAAILLAVAAIGGRPVAAEEPAPANESQTHVHRIVGLSSPERINDLRELVEVLPDVRLVKVDYERAEAEFAYDPAQVFPNASSKQQAERLDALLRQASFSTFSIRPPSDKPREQWQKIEISVAGLDCKACSYAAYDAVIRVEGVEQAQASFRDGLVVAWIDPEKTDRAALEAALTRRGVTLRQPESP